MGVLKVMDHSGDTQHQFKAADQVSVDKAMAVFAEFVGDKKHMAYTRDGKGGGQVIRAFDPNAEEIVIRPPLVSG